MSTEEVTRVKQTWRKTHTNGSAHDIGVGELHRGIDVFAVVKLHVSKAPELSRLPVLGEADTLDITAFAERLPYGVL